MAYGARKTVTLTTSSGGSVTDYIEAGFWRIDSIIYTKTDFADGVDITVTGEETGTVIWTGTDVNASTTVRPRAATHSTAGAAANYAATFPVNDKIFICNERIKIVVGSGGSTKTGALTFVLEM